MYEGERLARGDTGPYGLDRHPARLHRVGVMVLRPEGPPGRPAVDQDQMGGKAFPGGSEPGSDDRRQPGEQGHVRTDQSAPGPVLGPTAVTVRVPVQKTVEDLAVPQYDPGERLPHVVRVAARVLAQRLGKVGRHHTHPEPGDVPAQVSGRPRHGLGPRLQSRRLGEAVRVPGGERFVVHDK